MLGWLWRILVGRFGCAHEWKIMATIDVYDPDYMSRPCHRKYTLHCTRCGEIKTKTDKA